MTKYILIGGYPNKAPDGGKAVCREAVAGFQEPVRILIFLFARPDREWPQLFPKQRQFFVKNLPDIKLKFTLANKSNFINQIKTADLLYFSGGDTTQLTGRLNQNPGWTEFLDGKTIMGTSAGADILSTYNYDLELFKCSDGLGLIPIKTIVHYLSKDYTPPIGWKKAYEEIKKYQENLPVWTLREGEYKTIEV